MPDKEEKQVIVTEKLEKEPEYKQPDGRASRRGLIIIVSIVGLLLIGILIGGGVWIYNEAYQQSATGNSPYVTGSTVARFNPNPRYGYGRSVQTQVTSDSVTTTVYTYQTGVVVAVNSDSIVIAGNGKQTTIKTNSSTTYTNNVKPAVNDTVVIAGTTADSTITATEIRVAN
ncbi:MAG: hypothetical protein JWN26_626 [Candidatus Saccharibacteria bacterium]|nr:hypothetical protein [Candidatus Saccharibacteria bacterium]